MKLPINIATKLLVIIRGEVTVPASAMRHSTVEKMIDDGVLQKIQTGRTKAMLVVRDPAALKRYVHNHFGISDLADFVEKLSSKAFSRSEAVIISGDSKLSTGRTFKGFLVNNFSPVAASLRGLPLIINNTPGTFTFIYDYESFVPDATVTVVGLENPENFRYVERQQYLFKNIQPLFVSRYPYSRDLLKWLQGISNRYLHFGDLDFAGISIYLNEYKKLLGEKALFFIPENVEELIAKFGNRRLYDIQLAHAPASIQLEDNIMNLVNLFHRHKKVLEQEVFIGEEG